MTSDLTWLIALGALVISALTLIGRSFDKNLTIREYETYSNAVRSDIERVEKRLQHLEQTRPTTGELQILADSINKRMDELKRNQH
jgi:methylthioribose-1-phosphate isomerase